MEIPRFPSHLHKSVYHWSLSELDALIDALERDNLLSAEELTEYVPTKSGDEIKKIMNSCISASEDEILSGAISSQPSKPLGESSLDVVQNSLLSFIPRQFSSAKGIAQALGNLSAIELKADTLMLPPASSRGFLTSYRQTSGPDLPRMYKFLASLFLPGDTESLDYESAAAVLDMAICLITLVNRIMTHVPLFPGASLTSIPTELSSTVHQPIDRIGNVVALLATCRKSALTRLHSDSHKKALLQNSLSGAEVSPEKQPYGNHLYSLPFPAPVCVMNEVKLPGNFSQNRQLSTHLAKGLHNFCKLEEITNDLEDPALIQKRILDFILNPLGIFAQKATLINEVVASLHLLSVHYNQLFRHRLPKRFRRIERPRYSEVCQVDDPNSSDTNSTSEPLLIRASHPLKKSQSRQSLPYYKGSMRSFALSYITSRRGRRSKCVGACGALFRRVSAPVPREDMDSYFEKTFVSIADTAPSQRKRNTTRVGPSNPSSSPH